MGPKKGRRVRKIEVPKNKPTEFEDTAADIQRREERKHREREKGHRNRGRRGRGRKPGGWKLHTQQRREWPKIMQGQAEVTQKWRQRMESTSKSHSRGI